MFVLEVLESYGPDAILDDGVEDDVKQFHNEFRVLGEEVQFIG